MIGPCHAYMYAAIFLFSFLKFVVYLIKFPKFLSFFLFRSPKHSVGLCGTVVS